MTELPMFPFRRTSPFQPPPEYADLRRDDPPLRVLPADGIPSWLVTRYDDLRAILADPAVSAATPRPGFSDKGPADQPRPSRPKTFIQMDPPEHGRFRRMLAYEFSPRQVGKLRTAIERTADTLIEQMLAAPSPADLVRRFALPLSSLTICQLLGVPYSDHEFFEARTATIDDFRATPAERHAAREEVFAYLDRLVSEKERDPPDDLLGRLVTSQLRPGRLSHDELVSISVLLLVAGHDTTANMIGLGVLLLCTFPEYRTNLETAAGASAIVEETLRYYSIGDIVTCRVAKEDLEIGGRRIRAGERLIALNASANWDEREFPRPDEFDVTRPKRQHVAFGYGSHQCLGQELARLELEIAYRRLFTRLPGLRVAAAAPELHFKHDEVIFGLHELPVTW
jgi:cytochrome P450